MQYSVDDSQKMIFVNLTDAVTGKDIIAIQKEINDPNFKGRSITVSGI